MTCTWKHATIFRQACAAFLLATVVGCESFQKLEKPWAPPLPEENPNQFHFYDTRNWPYADEIPPVRIPAQFVAGLPAIPCILVVMPFTLFSKDNPTYDGGMAFLEAERMYMQYPGYALYRGSGYPFYIIKEGTVESGLYVYGLFAGKQEETNAGEELQSIESGQAFASDQTEEPENQEELEKLDEELPVSGDVTHPGLPETK